MLRHIKSKNHRKLISCKWWISAVTPTTTTTTTTAYRKYTQYRNSNILVTAAEIYWIKYRERNETRNSKTKAFSKQSSRILRVPCAVCAFTYPNWRLWNENCYLSAIVIVSMHRLWIRWYLFNRWITFDVSVICAVYVYRSQLCDNTSDSRTKWKTKHTRKIRN